ncbi:MAG TPA: polysaccharide deacetylase family protein [Pyrinomonadaceae bacterium]|nr:polysaccharide deacetylase family protein [Pyrinomonadaceae bacterium]
MRVPVLLYHKIDLPTADVKIRGAFTYPGKFENQISYLKKKGFEFYTAGELIKFYLINGEFPKKSVVVTFDDGWKDNYTNAFPILKKYGAKATIFLVPACVGKTTDKVTAEGERSREHLSENDILEMSESGVFEFASHSFNHKLFHQITDEEIEFEVTESKNFSENLTQKDCSVFAYPAGFFTDYAKNALRNAGYKAAFTTIYGAENNLDVFELNRIEILRRDGFPFRFGRKIRSIYE